MKGRSTFTADEIAQIRDLIRRKNEAPASAQKAIRARMRELGFYISDFGSIGGGFSLRDLDRLIQGGRITIVDGTHGATHSEPASLWARFSVWWKRFFSGVA
jgi:hypothetical protein